ncbi:MAG: GNAT family N-acetyltransferase [Eubacterium sp.]|nr:GNAT family N-acetyltransferase [Eubacterium sp.]
MSLHMKKITADFEEIDKWQKINNNAFPKEERMDIEQIIQLIDEKIFEVWAFYDKEQFVGYCAMLTDENTAYIFFLAIDSEKRSMGYGGQGLSLIKKQYADCQVVVDLEAIEEEASNIAQRKARRKFYLRNGFHETLYYLKYRGMDMEVLCADEKFNKDIFQHLLDNVSIENENYVLFKK